VAHWLGNPVSTIFSLHRRQYRPGIFLAFCSQACPMADALVLEFGDQISVVSLDHIGGLECRFVRDRDVSDRRCTDEWSNEK